MFFPRPPPESSFFTRSVLAFPRSQQGNLYFQAFEASGSIRALRIAPAPRQRYLFPRVPVSSRILEARKRPKKPLGGSYSHLLSQQQDFTSADSAPKGQKHLENRITVAHSSQIHMISLRRWSPPPPPRSKIPNFDCGVCQGSVSHAN